MTQRINVNYVALKYFSVTQHFISISLLPTREEQDFYTWPSCMRAFGFHDRCIGRNRFPRCRRRRNAAPHPQKEELLTLARRGDAGAQYHPGIMYMYGEEMEQDWRKAFKWVSLAAQQQFAPALYDLGLMHEQEQGVKQD